MRRTALLFSLAGIVAGALSPGAARAGTFSAPVLLPGTNNSWSFAINARGDAIAMTSEEHGARVYPLGTGTRLGRALTVTAPGGYALGVSGEDLRFAADGTIVAGLTFIDGTFPGGEGPHSSGPCCLRPTLASWHLGRAAPVLQVLTPKLGLAHNYEHAPAAPAVAGARGQMTAIWSEGGIGEPPERGHADLREAYGPVGGHARERTLASVPNGIERYVLTNTPSGRAVAAWLDDGSELHLAPGNARGEISGGGRGVQVPGLNVEQDSYGFTSDAAGDVIFWYEPHRFLGPGELDAIVSRDGRPFGPRRRVALVPGEAGRGSLVAGGDGSLVALWQWYERHDLISRASAALGRVGGALGQSVAIGSTPLAFVGGDGAAVVTYRQRLPGYSPEGEQNFRIDVVTAKRGRRFGRPRPVARNLENCGLDDDGELGLQPIAASPAGDAILHLTCESGRQYMVRYTP